jgi:hypothetical protein
MTHAWTHAWCKSPARDEAVRAAEDGRARPLPTLAEAIASPFAHAAERSSTASKTGEGQSGLRTERITLEITHNESFGVSHWSWVTILRIKSGESVRVVEEAVVSVDDRAYADRIGCDEERDFANRILDQRDAAIRERDKAKARVAELEGCSWVPKAERESLQARIEALEAEVKLFDDGQPTAPSDLGLWDTAKGLSERCKELAARLVTTSVRATAAEARVAELEAASGGGEGEPVDQKPGFYAYENCVGIVAFSKHHFGEVAGCEAVPLYRAPPQPRGWLTEEEREAITLAAAQAPESDFVTNEEGKHLRAVLTALLDRSTPPEVEIPEIFFARLSVEEIGQLTAALAAAGVEVKEVGRE